MTTGASGSTPMLAAAEEEPAKPVEKDYAVDPEVQGWGGSLVDAIKEGIVEKPPLRPFRESGATSMMGPRVGCNGGELRA